ncbi:MAG: dihydrodipicolinate synthase family protein [Verrucomicrobiales bacterium]|nr:dihydrodipicolinate synthase family protein [Verrucomicrobiales bacterium]
MPSIKLSRLVAAAHAPFHRDGSLNLAVVEKQAAHLIENRVMTAFICGSTGESHSLTSAERAALAARWMEVSKGTGLQVVVHVGSNCLEDARQLAAQAEELGAAAISALAPSYFKPRTVDLLVDCCAHIASAAPRTPFYFYDIPVLTGVNFSMSEFLEKAATRLPSLAGIKFTNADLMAYQLCLKVGGGAWDIPWGIDEAMLGALAAGATGAVGSSYNFAAPIYHRLWDAFAAGDLAAARAAQLESIRLIQLLAEFGYMAAAKAVMAQQGVDVGPPRLPNASLSDARKEALMERLAPFCLT